ncbi:MAG: MotA/TolQ/ExbB proton channel family protein [Planctomycetota bacterium]|jgi:hypothetical protein
MSSEEIKETGEENKADEKKSGFANPVSFALGALLFLFFIVSGIGLDRVAGYIDIPSILIVFGVTFAVLLMGPGYTDFKLAIARAIYGRVSSLSEADRLISIFELSAFTAIMSGCIGTFVGLINMFGGGMDDHAALTAGMAVALITHLYGIGLSCLFVLARFRIINSRLDLCVMANDESQKINLPSSGKITGLAVSVIFLAVVICFSFLYSISYISSYQDKLYLSINNDIEGKLVYSGDVTFSRAGSEKERTLEIRATKLYDYSDGYLLKWIVDGTIKDDERPIKLHLILSNLKDKTFREGDFEWPRGKTKLVIKASETKLVSGVK